MMQHFSVFDGEKIFRQAPIGIAIVDKDGKWLRINDAVANIVGYTSAEVEGKMTFQQITHPADVDADVAMTHKLLEGEIDYYEMVKRYISKNGRSVWVRLIVHAIRDPKGEFENFAAYILPILNGERSYYMTDGSASSSVVAIQSLSWKKFFTENWKWLLGVICAAAITFFNFAISWRESQKELEEIRQTISEMAKKYHNQPETLPDK